MLVAGLNTVGIRIPDNQIILRLVEMTGKPLTTTSANISGKPGTYSVEEVTAQLGEDIETGGHDARPGADESARAFHHRRFDRSARPSLSGRGASAGWKSVKSLKRFHRPEETEINLIEEVMSVRIAIGNDHRGCDLKTNGH